MNMCLMGLFLFILGGWLADRLDTNTRKYGVIKALIVVAITAAGVLLATLSVAFDSGVGGFGFGPLTTQEIFEARKLQNSAD